MLAVLLAFAAPLAVPKLRAQQNGTAAQPSDPNEPIEKEYHKLMVEDDDAHAAIDEWIHAANEAALKGDKTSSETLSVRIKTRLAPVRAGYETFIARHPGHARSRIAFGSFLNDQGDEEAAVDQWEKARETDPKIPSIWNNLANYYGHRGPVTKAFDYYAKAIELDSMEAVYFQNLATAVYMFRKDASEYYKLDETGVFNKALDLYRQAIMLDPTNFVLSTDYAESFYGTKPPRWADGLAAWEATLKLAQTEVEREGVFIHFGRIKTRLGRFDEAQHDLNEVTNAMYLDLKKTLLKNLVAAREGLTKAPPPTAAHIPAPK